MKKSELRQLIREEISNELEYIRILKKERNRIDKEIESIENKIKANNVSNLKSNPIFNKLKDVLNSMGKVGRINSDGSINFIYPTKIRTYEKIELKKQIEAKMGDDVTVNVKAKNPNTYGETNNFIISFTKQYLNK
jgi:predicted RNase H-like nuclease (RuvC/YqgF family)